MKDHTIATCLLIGFLAIFAVINIFWVIVAYEFNANFKAITKANTLDVAELKFKGYLQEFNKHYDGEEYERRFKNFKASLRQIAFQNALEGRNVFGLTKFSDMSDEEFGVHNLMDMGLYSIDCFNKSLKCNKNNAENEIRINFQVNEGNVPENFDWRDRGFVTPVLSQKKCNTCWAFSVVGVMETMAAIQGLGLTGLSIQELIDCMGKGCMEKGNVEKTLNYMCTQALVGSNDGIIVPDEEYPLNLHYNNTYCNIPPKPAGIMLQNYTFTCGMDENDMAREISSHGPLVAVVDGSNWKNYIGGVIRYACSKGHPNHAVQIVGYHGYNRSDGSLPYYIVKNSYGEDFGDHGYVKVAMMENVCGIKERVAKLNVMKSP